MNEIEELIKESLRDIRDLYNNETIDSKIIFPKYADKEPRYSEQELKCIFLKKIESSKFHYSVETPSNYKYRFVDNDEPRVLLKDENSKENFQSSMIDMSLYDKERNKISHIEFKYGQCPVFPVQKDFLKLLCETDVANNNYFIHYLGNSDDGTKKAILEKYKTALKNISETNENIKDDLEKRLKTVFVFVLFAGMKTGDNYFCFSLETLNNSEISDLKGEQFD